MNICDSIAERILTFFRRITKVRSERKNVLMAYAIHHTLQALKLSERVRDIEIFTGTSRKELYRIDECVNTDVEINNSTASLDVFCSALELSYEARGEIEQNARALMMQYSNSTNCILATSIYNYCAKHGVERSLKIICQTCDVSTESVRRLRKELTTKHPSIFKPSTLCSMKQLH
jgi:transcription initiation factor TFIIIB Brf1 subunit/transcription initiation factor TFIIB